MRQFSAVLVKILPNPRLPTNSSKHDPVKAVVVTGHMVSIWCPDKGETTLKVKLSRHALFY